MSAPTTRYSVTLPDGSTATRNSHRTYTHAIAVRRGAVWRVSAYCGSLELAGKEFATQARLAERNSAGPEDFRVPPPDEFRILPAVPGPLRLPRSRAPKGSP